MRLGMSDRINKMLIGDEKYWNNFLKNHNHNFGEPNLFLLKYAKKFIKGKKDLISLDIGFFN